MTGDMELLWQEAGLDAARGIACAVLLSSVFWTGLAISLLVVW